MFFTTGCIKFAAFIIILKVNTTGFKITIYSDHLKLARNKTIQMLEIQLSELV